jgi:hypothetical protein
MAQFVLEIARDLFLTQLHAKQSPPTDFLQALQIHTCLFALQRHSTGQRRKTVAAGVGSPTSNVWEASVRCYPLISLMCVAFKELSASHLHHTVLITARTTCSTAFPAASRWRLTWGVLLSTRSENEVKGC